MEESIWRWSVFTYYYNSKFLYKLFGIFGVVQYSTSESKITLLHLLEPFPFTRPFQVDLMSIFMRRSIRIDKNEIDRVKEIKMQRGLELQKIIKKERFFLLRRVERKKQKDPQDLFISSQI